MNNRNDNHGPEMMLGGVLLALFFVSFIIKALKNFFNELGQAFEAFGHAAGSFIFMLWNVLQVVGLIVLIIAALFAAIYFSIQYYRMVKEGTVLREWLQDSVLTLENNIESRLQKFTRQVDHRINDVDQRLTQALEKPELAPEPSQDPAKIPIQDVELTSSELGIASAGADSSKTASPNDMIQSSEGKSQSQVTETVSVTMSNPY